jgi:hypothetical protein
MNTTIDFSSLFTLPEAAEAFAAKLAELRDSLADSSAVQWQAAEALRVAAMASATLVREQMRDAIRGESALTF